MKKLIKSDVYQELYNCKLKDIDKSLSKFIKCKKIISKQNDMDPQEFEY